MVENMPMPLTACHSIFADLVTSAVLIPFVYADSSAVGNEATENGIESIHCDANTMNSVSIDEDRRCHMCVRLCLGVHVFTITYAYMMYTILEFQSV